MALNLPSQKLFLYFLPVIIGLSVFVALRDAPGGKAPGASLAVVSNSQSSNGNAPSWTPSPEEAALIKNGDTSVSATDTPDATGTVTDKVSQKLFADYISLKQDGTDNAENFTDVASNATNDIYANKAKDPYTSSDLKVLPGNADTVELATFAKNLLSVLEKYQSEQDSSDVVVTNDVSSPQFAPQMLALSKTFASLSKELLAIAVPQPLSEIYLLLVNNYGRNAVEYMNASSVGSDPVLAVAAIKNLKDNQTEEANLIKEINDYLSANGVIFAN